MTQVWKRLAAHWNLEVLADIAAIVATVLMLLPFLGVESAHPVVDCSQPSPPASVAPFPVQAHRVPPVRGLLEAEAATVLADTGFGVRVDYAPATDGANVGRVLAQTPSPGTHSSRGALVAIVIGSVSGR